MDTWLWISDLPSTAEWDESNSPLSYQLASSNSTAGARNQSMQLKAERRFMSSTETAITFSVEVEGFQPPHTAKKTLWLSDECPLSSDKPFLPLVLQLIREIIDRSPIGHDSVGARSKLEQLKREPIARMLETQSPESFSKFFNLIFLVRLFWLCACDAATEVGCLYFNSLLVPGIEQLSRDMHMPVLRTFLLSVGVDFELCVARAVGYISAKCLILKEMSTGLQLLTPSASNLGISYATEAHGLWVLKGYVPVQSMRCTRHKVPNDPFRIVDAKEAALRYVLAHQHLEAVVQFEYSVGFYDRYIQVSARIDNIRLHVVKLGFGSNDDMDYDGEVYFPSRIQVWVGPEIGSTCIAALCMRQLTANTDRYIKMQKSIQSSFNDTTTPRINVTEKRIKMKDWRLGLNSEGNVAIYDFILCDKKTGLEVYNMKPPVIRSSSGTEKSEDSTRKYYIKIDRSFTKSGRIIFGSDDCLEEVNWRLSREMEGSVLKWRIGCKAWVSYWPNQVESSYYHTRCIEWCHDVDLPLIPTPPCN